MGKRKERPHPRPLLYPRRQGQINTNSTATTLTRADAVKELRECYAFAAECAERASEIKRPWSGYGQVLMEDCVSDASAYGERIRELEAFLAVAP